MDDRLKKLIICTAAALFTLAAGALQAQEARQAAYFELGGSGILPTFNYERRLTPRWIGRIGLSFVTGSSSESSHTDTTFIVPLTVSSFTHRESNHHFEYGGGITIAGGDRQDLYEVSDGENFSTAFVTGIAGYRYQKPDGGFQFRSVFTPVAGGGDLLPWFGVSFGYAW